MTEMSRTVTKDSLLYIRPQLSRIAWNNVQSKRHNMRPQQ